MTKIIRDDEGFELAPEKLPSGKAKKVVPADEAPLSPLPVGPSPDSDIIERVKVMSLKPGDLVVFQLVDGTSMAQAAEFAQGIEGLQKQRPDISFAVCTKVDGVSVLRVARDAQRPSFPTVSELRNLRGEQHG